MQSCQEKKLFNVLEGVESKVGVHVEARRYDEATREYAKGFYQLIHQYFEEVMVNVDDEAVRKNRHAFMNRINRLYTSRIADLSSVTQVGEF